MRLEYCARVVAPRRPFAMADKIPRSGADWHHNVSLKPHAEDQGGGIDEAYVTRTMGEYGLATATALPNFRQLLGTMSIICKSLGWERLKAYSPIAVDFKGQDIHFDLVGAFYKYPGPWTICAGLKLAFKVPEKFPLRSGMTSF